MLKPRVGFGGHGVQVAAATDMPQAFAGNYLLSERIQPQLKEGEFWDVRVFVMAGQYVGGVLRSSTGAVTNVFQGGRVARLDERTTAMLERPALEAVALLDREADRIHNLPQPPQSELTAVDY